MFGSLKINLEIDDCIQDCPFSSTKGRFHVCTNFGPDLILSRADDNRPIPPPKECVFWAMEK
jgi:hypothetical protein